LTRSLFGLDFMVRPDGYGCNAMLIRSGSAASGHLANRNGTLLP